MYIYTYMYKFNNDFSTGCEFQFQKSQVGSLLKGSFDVRHCLHIHVSNHRYECVISHIYQWVMYIYIHIYIYINIYNPHHLFHRLCVSIQKNQFEFCWNHSVHRDQLLILDRSLCIWLIWYWMGLFDMAHLILDRSLFIWLIWYWMGLFDMAHLILDRSLFIWLIWYWMGLFDMAHLILDRYLFIWLIWYWIDLFCMAYLILDRSLLYGSFDIG